MKKRTKITLRTKIYLTIVALLALTGVFYAQFPPSHPTPFVFTVPFPTGVAAARDLLLVSEYCSEKIDTVDCNGNATLFTTLPGCPSSDHNGITFDHFGTYGNDMIVTCQAGFVYRVNGAGTATQIA